MDNITPVAFLCQLHHLDHLEALAFLEARPELAGELAQVIEEATALEAQLVAARKVGRLVARRTLRPAFARAFRLEARLARAVRRWRLNRA